MATHVSWGFITDGELAAEWRRRYPHGVSVDAAATPEGVTPRAILSEDHFAIVKRYLDDRDEWKRRAELAEARWSEVKAVAIEAGLKEGFDAKSWLLATLTRAQQDRGRYNACVIRGEDLAHGIKRLPAPQSEPHAHLDEDLLCDDA